MPKRPPEPTDPIRDQVIARAAELELSAWALAAAADPPGAVSRQHLHMYLTRQASISTAKLAAIMPALGLKIANTTPRRIDR